MARPKLKNGDVKVNIHLTVSPEVRDMLAEISNEKNISISEYLAEYAKKDFKKLQKKSPLA